MVNVATYRQVHVSYWQDPFIIELTPEEKYFYIYLMTNSKTTQCGIYEISKRVMQMETGYNEDTINKLIQRFIEYKKILYCDETKEIMLLNWAKYNSSKSESVQSCIQKELSTVKNAQFVRFYSELSRDSLHSGGRLPGDSGEKEEEKEEQKEEEKQEELSGDKTPYDVIVNLYKDHCVSFPKMRDLTDKRKKSIRALWKKYNSLDVIKEAFKKAEASDFLSGRNGEWTGCGFDWLINTNNMVKVLEGNYDNRPAKPKPGPGGKTTFDDKLNQRRDQVAGNRGY